jgi:hypothetical protein
VDVSFRFIRPRSPHQQTVTARQPFSVISFIVSFFFSFYVLIPVIFLPFIGLHCSVFSVIPVFSCNVLSLILLFPPVFSLKSIISYFVSSAFVLSVWCTLASAPVEHNPRNIKRLLQTLWAMLHRCKMALCSGERKTWVTFSRAVEEKRVKKVVLLYTQKWRNEQLRTVLQAVTPVGCPCDI